MALKNNQVAVDLDTAGDHVIAPAVAGQSIQVTRIVLTLAARATVQFKSGANALSGPMSITSLMFTDESGSPWFVTNPGEALSITLGASVGCAGFLLVQYV